jgi:hypothetical protein
MWACLEYIWQPSQNSTMWSASSLAVGQYNPWWNALATRDQAAA